MAAPLVTKGRVICFGERCDEGDVMALCRLGADAVLIGEMLMRAPDKQEKLKKLRLACSCVSGDENRL